jgi:glycosyltransferase involved in cell wall biosynthesis
MRWLYPLVDQIIAVSQGVAEDIREITGLPPERITVIHNPVITARLLAMAREPVAHPWFNAAEPPVILGAGRLTRQKDFPTLIRAFARVQRHRPARLVILGEGRQRLALKTLAAELGVASEVDLPGFVVNPYAYMAKAAVFALSSTWEGSPNVLTEALALGTPAVATDCPSGPREILGEGRYGALVPVSDSASLAQAILATLDDPPDCTLLRQAVREYSLESSVLAYLQALGLEK